MIVVVAAVKMVHWIVMVAPLKIAFFFAGMKMAFVAMKIVVAAVKMVVFLMKVVGSLMKMEVH